jgi:flavin reductase (DIM6/NTAB) family NADH-FMN oxidoreductase RutF
MKFEIGEKRPENFKTYWGGQYEVFSHFEYACAIPSILFAVTTLKENGKPNVNFHGWSSFTGDGDGFFAVLGGVFQGSHTYANIMRTGEFVVNFISKDYYDACSATIKNNKAEDDEFEAGGFTQEPSKTVSCPRIAEAFMNLECRFEKQVELSGAGKIVLMIGRVKHIALQEEYAKEYIEGNAGERFGDNGFMLSIHQPKNLATGEGKDSGIAVLKAVRTI